MISFLLGFVFPGLSGTTTMLFLTAGNTELTVQRESQQVYVCLTAQQEASRGKTRNAQDIPPGYLTYLFGI